MTTDKTRDKSKSGKRQANDLLGELESIKTLLGEELEQIPVLEEMVDDLTQVTAQQQPAPKKETGRQSHVLPGQKGLFDKEKERQQVTSRKPAAKKHSAAEGENPFLPQHIRKRLGSSAELAQPLLDVSRQNRQIQKQSFATTRVNAETSNAIIDELVRQYLPLIEEALRKRLKAIAKEESV